MKAYSRGDFLALGLRSLWRDWRAGELRLLLMAVMLAVAALTSVGFFADRIKGGLQRDARTLLGGDAVVSSDRPTPPRFVAKARELGLQTNQSIGFPTMARGGEQQGGASKLVALKAVQSGYPLRGTLKVSSQPEQPEQPAVGIPPLGAVWVDNSLLEALGLKVGDVLFLGNSSLRVDRIIRIEPDRGGGFMNFAPRVMINEADLAATALVQPASRISYRMAVAGDSEAVRIFSQWADKQINPVDAGLRQSLRGVRLESLESGRPEMRRTIDRAEKFLNLVALLAALLCAVAVSIAARSFAARHLDDCAMLRVLGVAQRTMALGYTFEFAVIGLTASVLGVALGFAVHHGFVVLLAGLVDAALPSATLWPAWFGLGIGITLLAAFGLPPVLQLAQVPPLRVIRRDVGGLKPASLGVLLVGVLGFAALLMASSRDLLLGGIAVGGFAAAALIFAGLSHLAVKLLRRSVNESTAPRWLVLATRQISARPTYTVVQTSALAVGLLALVLLVLLRTDLIASWRKATPADAPNRFVINIQPEQGEAFLTALKRAGVTRLDYFPMIRGRLASINDRVVIPDSYSEERAKHLVDREFNLSHAGALPAHNEVTAGAWTPNKPGEISVEEGIAKTLGLEIGDMLTFDIGGLQVKSRITSLRKVDWGSMRANFFVMYTVQEMPEVPATYMAAFKASETRGFDNALVRQFPNVTNVDMSLAIAQLQRVLDQVIRAVEFLFGFTLAAGLVVLFATVTATREERTREFAVLRAVGARNQLLRQVQRAELAGVGMLAGVLASLLALMVGWLLARYAFEFTWDPVPWVVPATGVLGAALALAAGWWGLRSVLETPVMVTLRRAAQ